jgi:hypothetical protein
MKRDSWKVSYRKRKRGFAEAMLEHLSNLEEYEKEYEKTPKSVIIKK